MYERAFSFKEGLGMVVLNSQYGFIDHTGQIQIPFKYTAAHSFEQECARVCHDGLWGLIDRQGETANCREALFLISYPIS